MHPVLSRQLFEMQLEEARRHEGLFAGSMVLQEFDYPNLFVTFKNYRGELRMLNLECSNYDFQPLQVRPVDPVTRGRLQESEWMTRGSMPPSQHGPFPDHHLIDGQFLCLEGTRDYYTHQGHRPSVVGQRWETFRSEQTLTNLLQAIKTRFDRGEWA